MQRRLPPFHALRTFEAAANCLSFTKAADELHITQSAVSQQIRQLESALGRTLFRRLPRKLLLTEDGQRLFEGVSAALKLLRDTMEDLEHSRSGVRLVMSVLPSFGSKWLVPRLHRFLRTHPHIRATVLPSDVLVDFDKEDVDVGLRWGEGYWPRVESRLIFRETLFPVCAPAILATANLEEPRDLLGLPLIGDVTHDMWDLWFKANGVDVEPVRHSALYDDTSNLIQAAVDGQGIACTRSILVLDDLATGRLVRPFAQEVAGKYAYYLVYPRRLARDARVKAFAQWLDAEAEVSLRALEDMRQRSNGVEPAPAPVQPR